MTALESSITFFKSLANVPELDICYLSVENGYLTISAPIEYAAAAIWANRSALKKAAIISGFSGSILIKCEGERYGPRIDLSD